MLFIGRKRNEFVLPFSDKEIPSYKHGISKTVDFANTPMTDTP